MDMSFSWLVLQQSSVLWPDPAADVPNDHLRCSVTSEAYCACAKGRVRKHTAHAQKEKRKDTAHALKNGIIRCGAVRVSYLLVDSH